MHYREFIPVLYYWYKGFCMILPDWFPFQFISQNFILGWYQNLQMEGEVLSLFSS
jgi:hypothetical protein